MDFDINKYRQAQMDMLEESGQEDELEKFKRLAAQNPIDEPKSSGDSLLDEQPLHIQERRKPDLQSMALQLAKQKQMEQDDEKSKLESAIDGRRDLLKRLGMIQAMQQLGQSISGGQSGVFNFKDPAMDTLKESAKLDLKDARSRLSAYQKAQLGSDKGRYQTKTITKDGKNYLYTFDTATKKLSKLQEQDPVSGKVTDITPGYALGTFEDAFGNDFLLNKGTGERKRIGVGAGYSEEESKLLKKKPTLATLRSLRPKLADEATKVVNEYNKDLEKERSFASDLEQARKLVDKDIPSAAGSLYRLLARSIGREVGTLTESDVRAFSGNPSIQNQLVKGFKKYILGTGELSELDKKEFAQLIKTAGVGVSDIIRGRTIYYAKKLKNTTNIDNVDVLRSMLAAEEMVPANVKDQRKEQAITPIMNIESGEVKHFKSDVADQLLKKKDKDGKLLFKEVK